ncbi:MAG TPA: hypothetical protein PLJ35_22100 [Anaerolineae bacterium]|nr:hypothetical protein [Anaerolineae bacterium]HOR01515.1 hypothetical protein [Anaerolineae bacterium]HPL29039.1 hypothetical protein [Anaerolineae bacterium]
MSERTVPLDYANSIAFDLQKAFWDERGKGARFRMTTVGRAYFQERCLGRIEGTEVASIVQEVGRILQDEGIIGSLSASEDGRLLRLRVQGCLHRSLEDQVAALGSEPLACVPANIVALSLEQRLNRPVELAEIKLADGGCELLLVVFDQRPHLGGGA